MQKFKFLNIIADDQDVDIRIDGEIVSDDIAWYYDWLDIEHGPTPKGFRKFLEDNKGKNITIHIDSPGGDVMAASAIYTALSEYRNKVTAKIEGLCASAATVIAMSADKVVMSPTALFMIHQAMTSASGNKQDMKQAAQTLQACDEAIINAYERKTGLSRERLNSLMEKETWMDADTAKEYGFVDEILGENDFMPKDVITNIMHSRKLIYNVYKEKNHIVDDSAEQENLEKEKLDVQVKLEQERLENERKEQEKIEARNKMILAIFDFNAKK